MFEARLIINGSEIAAPGRPVYERRGPAHDYVVTRAAAGDPEDANAAADAAAAAFPAWSTTAPEIRAACLLKAADLFLARTDEVVAIAREELGSADDWTRFNVGIAARMLRQAATLAGDPREEEVDSGVPGLRYLQLRKPAGVVLGIAPWNAAVTLATRAVASPLALGNTVVLKASELCPKTHEWVVRGLMDAGLPAGVLNFITNAPDQAEPVVEALAAHPAIRRVNFTGSTRVGREIAIMAARHLKPCLLELSGKGTMVVLADADLDAAAEAAAFSAFFNNGQICMSTERIVVEDRVADAFLDRFLPRAEALRTPSGRGSESPLGHLIAADAGVRVNALVEDALARGARLACGGESFGSFVQPTVLDHVSPGMRIYSEEAFAPLAAILRVEDAEEALSIANDTAFGLVISIFSGDTARATEFARRTETGIAHVNGATVYDDPAMPFGGVKASGYGRFGGKAAIEEFTEIQWIAIHDDGSPRPPALLPGDKANSAEERT